MDRSILSGGRTHVRYCHTSRPRILHVACPKCGGLAQAEKPSEINSGVIVSDLSPGRQVSDWRVQCLTCICRLEGLGYDELPKLFFTEDRYGIWAWNRDHLSTLLQFLKGEMSKDDPYEWFMTYVPGDWQRHKKRTIKLLEALRDLPVCRPSSMK